MSASACGEIARGSPEMPSCHDGMPRLAGGSSLPVPGSTWRRESTAHACTTRYTRAAEWCSACAVRYSRSRSSPVSSVRVHSLTSAGLITRRAASTASRCKRSAPAAKLRVTFGLVAAHAADRNVGSKASVRREGSTQPTRSVFRTSSSTAARIASWERSGRAEGGEEMLTLGLSGGRPFVVPQPLGELLQHGEHDARVFLEHLAEPLAFDRHRGHRRGRHDARRARPAVDQGDLAEEVAGDQPVDAPAVANDLRLALEQDVESVAGLVLLRERRSLLEVLLHGERRDVAQMTLRQAREQRNVDERLRSSSGHA